MTSGWAQIEIAGRKDTASSIRGSGSRRPRGRLELLVVPRLWAVEGEAPYLFDRVMGAVTLSDGRIAVADMGSSQVRFFDRDGRHLFSVGGQGEGPEEFRTITGVLSMPGDALGVVDRYERIQVLDADGRYGARISTGAIGGPADPLTYHLNPPRPFEVIGALDGAGLVGREASPEQMVEEYVEHSSPPLPEALARGRTFAEELAPFSEMRVDRGGSVWLRKSDPGHATTVAQYLPTFDAPSTWAVISPDGRWLGDVRLPPSLHVIEVGEDHLLALYRDDFDVEYLRFYELRKP